MKQDQLQAAYGKVRVGVEAVCASFNELQALGGETKPALLGIYVHEGYRRLEEFLHRVNDVTAVLSIRTEENLNRITDQALANGTAINPDGTKAPAMRVVDAEGQELPSGGTPNAS